ncbi:MULTISPECIES: hypothetical protein [Pseudomonas]|uniref:hypothetical protein n=1 Tax=Pseudomonas TaxID=286 RepID=UPI003A88C8B1
MSTRVINRLTGEELKVELELGEHLWLRNMHDDIEHALRIHLPLERWRFVGTLPAVDDVPMLAPAVPLAAYGTAL